MEVVADEDIGGICQVGTCDRGQFILTEIQPFHFRETDILEHTQFIRVEIELLEFWHVVIVEFCYFVVANIQS